MKLIIDIPDDVHNKILEIYNSCEELHTRENLYQTIAKGKPYEERPQGEWIPIKSLMEDNYHSRISFRCNQCRYIEGYRAKYCAGCGAFMRAEDGG